MRNWTITFRWAVINNRFQKLIFENKWLLMFIIWKCLKYMPWFNFGCIKMNWSIWIGDFKYSNFFLACIIIINSFLYLDFIYRHGALTKYQTQTKDNLNAHIKVELLKAIYILRYIYLNVCIKIKRSTFLFVWNK